MNHPNMVRGEGADLFSLKVATLSRQNRSGLREHEMFKTLFWRKACRTVFVEVNIFYIFELKTNLMPILSILIPSITQRISSHLLPLIHELEKQISLLENPEDVELVVFTDNKRRSIGHKRQGALDLARGLFIAYVDDDDKVDELYVTKAIESIKANAYVDVITFKQWVILNDAPPISLTFKLGHPTYDDISDAFPIRPPFHVCFWRRDLVKGCTFPDLMYHEDSAWVEQANKLAKTSYHIDHHMMTYIFNSNVTQAGK